MLRLGYQGIEFLETGALTLPMREPERNRILAVRTGSVPFDEVLAEADELAEQARDARPVVAAAGAR